MASHQSKDDKVGEKDKQPAPSKLKAKQSDKGAKGGRKGPGKGINVRFGVKRSLQEWMDMPEDILRQTCLLANLDYSGEPSDVAIRIYDYYEQVGQNGLIKAISLWNDFFRTTIFLDFLGLTWCFIFIYYIFNI